MGKRFGQRLCFCPGDNNWERQNDDPLFIPVMPSVVPKLLNCNFRKEDIGDGRFYCEHPEFDAGTIKKESALVLYSIATIGILRTDGLCLPYNYPKFCAIAEECLELERDRKNTADSSNDTMNICLPDPSQ